MTTQAAHVLTILAVEDLARAKRFYSVAFNWPLAIEAPVYAEFALPAGMRLGLYERAGFGRTIGRLPARLAIGEIAPTELYLQVEDLAAAIDQLHRAGGRMLSALAPRPWGDEAAYFADLDGNVLVVARPEAPAADAPT